jgi:hypothetical protein
MRDVNRSAPEVGYETIEMADEKDFDAGNQSILPGSSCSTSNIQEMLQIPGYECQIPTLALVEGNTR